MQSAVRDQPREQIAVRVLGYALGQDVADIAGNAAIDGTTEVDAHLEAGVHVVPGLRVGDIKPVVPRNEYAARSAELRPLVEKTPFLIEDL